MPKKNESDKQDYQFIREKIVLKKKNYAKRILLSILGTVALAVIFGFCARFAFVKSEKLVGNILGITEAPNISVSRTPIEIPSVTSKPSSTPSPIPTLPPTPTAGDEPVDVTPVPTKAPTTIVPVVTEGPISGSDALLEMYAAVKQVADKAARYMAKIELVTITTDWFGEILESSTYTSGVILGDNGVELMILVNAERIAACDRIDITIGNTHLQDVKVYASNEEYSFAILSVLMESLTSEDIEMISYAVFGDSSEATVGTPLIAIGGPNGFVGSHEITMVTTTGDYAYMTDNKIEISNIAMLENAKGSGVLINLSGEIVGLLTHKFKDEINANTATMISVNRVKGIIQNLANDTMRNYIGLIVKEAPSSVLDKLGIENGLYITEVKEGSPAELAGLKKGDVIVSAGSNAFFLVEDYNDCLNQSKVGDMLKFKVIRGDKNITVSVTVTATK